MSYYPPFLRYQPISQNFFFVKMYIFSLLSVAENWCIGIFKISSKSYCFSGRIGVVAPVFAD